MLEPPGSVARRALALRTRLAVRRRRWWTIGALRTAVEPLTAWRARPSLTDSRTIRSAGAAAVLRTRAQFVHRQLAVAVFVELAQRGGCIGDFGFVDDAVVIRVQHGNERRHRRSWPVAGRIARLAVARRERALALGARTARSVAVARWWTLTPQRPGLVCVLGCGDNRWRRERQRHQEDCDVLFHGAFSLLLPARCALASIGKDPEVVKLPCGVGGRFVKEV